MIRRKTITTFKIPATFTPERTDDALEIVQVTRRGHVDPVVMRDLALARGATGAKEIEVGHFSVRGGESRQDAKFLVNVTGPAKPLRVTI